MKNMFNFLIIVAVIYVAIVATMAVFQRKLLYLPDKNIRLPEQYGLSDFEEYFIYNSDNIKIQLWYKPAKKHLPTIIYFHGNASHIGNRAGIFSALSNKGFGVLAVSYRGYGKSSGTPSEQGLYADARSAINFAINQKNIPLSDIIIYGESLGSGVAVQMASEMNFAGLILQAPYTSIADRASEIYWFLPVRMILQDNFNSLSKIAKIHSPLLIFHGELDSVIPISQGKAIFDAAPQPKKAVYFSDIEHNNFDSETIANEVFKFISDYDATK